MSTRILIARHGISDGNLEEENYICNGDMGTALAKPLGWQQAIAAGQFLKSYYKATGTRRWPAVFVSGFRRARETLSGILHGLGAGFFPGKPQFREDTRLVEEFWGAAARLARPGTHTLDWRIAGQVKDLQYAVFERDPFMTPHLFGESRMSVNARIKAFLDGPIREISRKWFGPKDALVVCHGYVIQEFIRELMNLPMDAKIRNAGNCDIFEAIGSPEEGWAVRRIYDGEAMRAVNEPLADLYKPATFEILPRVPEGLR